MSEQFDLKKLSTSELSELITAAEKEKTNKAVKEKIEAYNQLLLIANGVGLSVADLIVFGEEHKKTNKVTKKAEPRFRNKNDETQTWTGRGKKPKWLVAEIEKGAKLSDFTI